MTRYHWLLMVAGLIAGLLISGRFVLLAQDRPGTAQPNPSASPRQDSAAAPKVTPDPTGLDEREPAQNAAPGSTKAATLQDALLRPYRFPFCARPLWSRSARTFDRPSMHRSCSTWPHSTGRTSIRTTPFSSTWRGFASRPV